MATYTPNLNLFKYDPTSQEKIKFSIQQALNNNWDKIDEAIGQGSYNVIIDSVLSESSTNPVQNKVIKIALDEKVNISELSDVAFSGDYDDLDNKPMIPSVQTTLSSFTDDLGTSPTHTHSQYLTEHQDISGKADIAPAITSLNTSGTITLNDNADYYIVPTGNIAFTLPTVTDTTKKHRIEIELYLTSTYTIDWGLGNNPNYYNKTAPDLSTAGTYNILYQYSISKSAWYVGGAEIGVDS